MYESLGIDSDDPYSDDDDDDDDMYGYFDPLHYMMNALGIDSDESSDDWDSIYQAFPGGYTYKGYTFYNW
ncbi:Oidioi.mRNA.OKI2018_I69.XSR.g13511.t1.cds [Oikopleura dioica]|uniref:Oidioi.mRNA.OKI2018_I69.XSR.g13511.t1.cds n=1 Tax=Oikopleura dioica TaxID=34765 RepID=A0ABN7SE08_OIKDI|nr:Oidioi.mRNA.OKI2018_I69.XSR.g13511.t1.cds [Oikopleura dioica]